MSIFTVKISRLMCNLNDVALFICDSKAARRKFADTLERRISERLLQFPPHAALRVPYFLLLIFYFQPAPASGPSHPSPPRQFLRSDSLTFP
jgi:hypothetical protein